MHETTEKQQFVSINYKLFENASRHLKATKDNRTFKNSLIEMHKPINIKSFT